MSDTALEAGASASGSRHTVDPGRPEHPSGDDRFALVDTHLRRVHDAQDQLIETLHVAQDVFGFLSDDVLLYVARALRLPPSMVYGVATFYHLFTFEPPGEHTCTVSPASTNASASGARFSSWHITTTSGASATMSVTRGFFVPPTVASPGCSQKSVHAIGG